VEPRSITVDDGSEADVGYLCDNGESSIGVEDVQRGPDENGSDAEEAIVAALAGGARPSREVKADVCAALECSKRTVERAAKRMAQRGDLAIEQGGYPRTTTWALVSGDTTATPVATSPNGCDVANGSDDVVTDVSPSSSDSGDTPNCDVATEHALVDAIRDAFDAEEIDTAPDTAILLDVRRLS
jgi:hypothetical protein